MKQELPIHNSLPNTSGECLIVLGMHRSGLSVLRGCLNLLGVNVGLDELGQFRKFDSVDYFW